MGCMDINGRNDCYLLVSYDNRSKLNYENAASLLRFFEPSPPFSAHLLYALVAYGRLHSEAWRMKLGNLEESSVALLNDDDGTNHSTLISNNEERPQSPPHEAIEWPHIGRFFPIWILQLIYPLFLCFLAVATLGIYSIKSFPSVPALNLPATLPFL